MRVTAAMLVPLLGLVAGCAGNGAGLDSNGRPIGAGGGGGGGVLTADYQSIQDNVFTPICTVCHAGGGAPQGLRLDATNAYTLLVGVPSTEVPSILRIKPGDPDGSYIIQKLEGHAAVGAQMPFGGPPLPGATIAVLRQWIADGASRAAAAATGNMLPLQMRAVVPAAGDVLAEPPRQIVVAFNRELDATRVDAGSMRLERLTDDVRADDALGPVASTVTAHLMIPSSNAQALLLTPVEPLTAGHYRVVMRAAPGMEVADMAGRTLEGAAHAANGDVLVTTFDVEVQPR